MHQIASESLEPPVVTTLGLLASPLTQEILDLLLPHGEKEVQLRFGDIAVAAYGAGDELSDCLFGLEAAGLVKRINDRYELREAGTELLELRALLHDWIWSGPIAARATTTRLGATYLAEELRGVWAGDILVSLAIRPATRRELLLTSVGYSESSLKRLLRAGRKADIIKRGVDGSELRRYGLTRHGMGLARLIAGILRFERRHLAHIAKPADDRLLLAGLMIVAQTLELPGVRDRELAFEVVDEDGEYVVGVRASYRDGKVRRFKPSPRLDDIAWIRGAPDAWYDLVVDGDTARMLAQGAGATRALGQIHRSIKKASRPEPNT